MSKLIPKGWAYKLTVEQVEYFLDSKDLSVFTGCFKRAKSIRFLNEFSQMFNNRAMLSDFQNDVMRLRLFNKINELRAMYNALQYSEAPNSKKRFNELFKKDFKPTDENFKLINDKAEFFINKLKSIPNKSKKEGLSFSEIVAMVENSRGVPIDRKMKLFQFKRIYDIELKKWQKI
ncbi:MAG: hypothetical protein ACOC2F_00305, partial [Bacteroidota bacterium]